MKALVIDGYNAIHKIPYLKNIIDNENLFKARTEITSLAEEYKRKRGGIAKCIVVFDGKDTYKNSGFCSPKNQLFSKTGMGDEEVINTVKLLSKKYQVEVVTDDNFIINNSRVYKATILSVSEFMRFLHKNKSIEKHTPSKISQKDISKINNELIKEWGLEEDYF
jgi:predicted RNA-binding protein with PIN domain